MARTIPSAGAFQSMSEAIDVSAWASAAQQTREREFRQAVHTLLVGIASSESLRGRMAIKGAILLSLRHGGRRFTADVDFSTEGHYREHDDVAFQRELQRSLLLAVQSLNYGLDCRIQGSKVRPRREDADFQTVELRIGYAPIGTPRHERLLAGKSPTILKVDYSFNETTLSVDSIDIGDHRTVLAYSLHDLVAEKLRAILQQKTRGRYRRQDAYDIHALLARGDLDTDHDRSRVLQSLLVKCRTRDLSIDKDSVAQKEVRERSRREYEILASEISGDLPPFEQVFEAVLAYYQSLPWAEARD